jgi:hypothetical protein
MDCHTGFVETEGDSALLLGNGCELAYIYYVIILYMFNCSRS